MAGPKRKKSSSDGMPRTRLGVDVFTTGQVATLLGIAPRTIAKWIDRGDLSGTKINMGRKNGHGSNYGDRRIYRADLVKFCRDRGHRLPAGFLAAGASCVTACDWSPRNESMIAVAERVVHGTVASVLVGYDFGLAPAASACRELKRLDRSLFVALLVSDDVEPAGHDLTVADAVFTRRADAAAWVEMHAPKPESSNGQVSHA